MAMKLILRFIKRYLFFFISLICLILLLILSRDIGAKAIISAQSSFLQMLLVLPPIMLLLGLMDVWIPREVLMKYMGDNSGAKGIFLALLLGSVAAGPMYAAFPFTAVLLKKGVRFSNVIIFMNAWCVTKISTLLFEVSALGFNFTLARFIIDLPGVILLGFLVERLTGKDEVNELYNSYENDVI